MESFLLVFLCLKFLLYSTSNILQSRCCLLKLPEETVKKELEDSTVKYVCNYTHSQEHLDWKTEALRIVFTSNNLHFDRTILYTVNQCTLTQYCNISMFVIFSQKIGIVSQNNKNEWKVSFLCDVSVLRIRTCMWWQTNTHHRQQDRTDVMKNTQRNPHTKYMLDHLGYTRTKPIPTKGE